jgi:hypothetical protein
MSKYILVAKFENTTQAAQRIIGAPLDGNLGFKAVHVFEQKTGLRYADFQAAYHPMSQPRHKSALGELKCLGTAKAFSAETLKFRSFTSSRYNIVDGLLWQDKAGNLYMSETLLYPVLEGYEHFRTPAVS